MTDKERIYERTMMLLINNTLFQHGEITEAIRDSMHAKIIKIYGLPSEDRVEHIQEKICS